MSCNLSGENLYSPLVMRHIGVLLWENSSDMHGSQRVTNPLTGKKLVSLQQASAPMTSTPTVESPEPAHPDQSSIGPWSLSLKKTHS